MSDPNLPSNPNPPAEPTAPPPAPVQSERDALSAADSSFHIPLTAVRPRPRPLADASLVLHPGAMPTRIATTGDQWFSQAKIVAAWTMVSRVLGLVRESTIAAVFGARWVADSFYLAFQLPNLFRRLFGEGALSAAFIPVFTEEMERSPKSAWRLASASTTLLLFGLGLLTLLGEGVLLGVWAYDPHNEERVLFLQLAAIMLAFFPAVCAVAILGGMLNVLRHFAVPALAPTMLNICMIAGAFFPMSRWSDDPDARIYAVAVGVTVAGVVELAMMWIALRRFGSGLRISWDWSHPGLRKIASLFAPMVIGLGVLQIMEFLNSAVVRALTAPANDPGATFELWGRTLQYPLREGSLSILQCAQRIYQFPLGVFATALGTAVFPLFSLCAARNDTKGLAEAVAKAVRLSLFIGLPSGIGMMLVAEPLSDLLFGRGRFTPEAVAHTSQVVLWYGAGMWAFCLHQIVTRAYYSLKDSKGPLRWSLALLPLNFVLNIALVWLPELNVSGVSLSTTLTFSLTALFMLRGLRSKLGHGLPLRTLARSGLRTALATAIMAGACWAVMQVPLPELGTFAGKLMRTAVPVVTGLVVFAVACKVLRMPEPGELLRRGARPTAGEQFGA